MKKLYLGLTYTKAQWAADAPALVYSGPSRSAALAAVQSPVDAGTASYGTIEGNLSPHNRVVRRNLAGA